MDREGVNKLYLEYLYSLLDVTKKQMASTKKDIDDAPKRMESRYDSSKIEHSWIANGHLIRLRNLESVIEKAVNKRKTVVVGSKVTIALISNNVASDDIYRYYFINNIDSKENNSSRQYESIDPKSEMAIELLSLCLDDTFAYREKKKDLVFQVVEIETLCPKNEKLIDIDSVVCLQDMESFEKEWYLITPSEGGVDLVFENNVSVYALSKKTPLARSIIGLKEGESVEFVNGDIHRRLKVSQIL